MIDAATLRRLWPRAPGALVDAIAAHAPTTCARYGLTTPRRLAHFLAQISHESGGGTIARENLNYGSAARIAAVWPRRFDVESAAPYVRNPAALADKVYNGRMGNRPGSDDGYVYRGGGLLQLTGRASYRAIGAAVGLPLEQNPELVAAPTYALDIAACEFARLGCLPFCDRDDIEGVTHRVNGGYTGLASRKAWLKRWEQALAADGGRTTEDGGQGADGDDRNAPSADIPPVELPRGSDERLPAPVPPPQRDRTTWAAIVGAITAAGTMLGQAADAIRPLITDPRTLGAAAAIALIAAAVILIERNRTRAQNA